MAWESARNKKLNDAGHTSAKEDAYRETLKDGKRFSTSDYLAYLGNLSKNPDLSGDAPDSGLPPYTTEPGDKDTSIPEFSRAYNEFLKGNVSLEQIQQMAGVAGQTSEAFGKGGFINESMEYGKDEALMQKILGAEGAEATPIDYAKWGGEKGDPFLGQLPSLGMYNMIKDSDNAQEMLMAMAMQDAIKGRMSAVDTLQDRSAAITADPLEQAIKGQAQGLVEQPDIISDDMLSQMLGAASGQTANSFRNQAAGLSHTLGGMNIDPSSGVAQDLAAQLRFQSQQADASRGINLKTQAAQLNRSGLENALKMGAGISSQQQGMQNQIQGAIANLMSGQPLAQIAPETAAMGLAQNMYNQQGAGGGGGGFNTAGALSGAASGAAAGSVFGPVGAVVGGVGMGLYGGFGGQ